MADPSPVPAVTKGDVAVALYRSDVAADLGLRTETCNRLADVVLALLAEAPRPKVLFRGRLYDYEDMGGPIIKIAGDPEAHVRKADLVGMDVAVVALGPPVPEAPEGGSDGG